MRTVAGLLGYLGVLFVLLFGGFVGTAVLLSPTVTSPTRTVAYGVPTRVGQPATVLAEAPAETPAVETHTFRIGPEIIHRAPEPPSQAEMAKLRLKASEQELHRSRIIERRDAPKIAATRDDSAATPVQGSADARHTSNF
jgi:hypothetical protein